MQNVNNTRLLENAKALSLTRAEVASVSRTMGSVTVQAVGSRDEIFSLEKDWRALEEVCPNTVLFQSFAWCCNHLDFAGSDPAFKPVVFVIREDDRVSGLFPLAIQEKGRLRVLTGFSEPFQQYTEILFDPGYATDEKLARVRKHLFASMKAIGADYFHFGQVREEGMLARLFGGEVPVSGEKDAAPFVRLADFEDHDTYLKSIKAKTRKNLRNAKNRLEREAPVVHEVARSGALMQQVVERAYEGREAWLERLGITSRAFRNQDFEAFLKRFADDGAGDVETIAMSLKHGETAISDQWGFVYRGRYYAFMATWNPDYEASSPGRLHLGEVINTCFDEGFETADFMIPASSYKMTWTDEAAPVRDYVLPLSLKGRAYSALWLNFARPLSKKIFFALPPKLRGMLVKRVLPAVE